MSNAYVGGKLGTYTFNESSFEFYENGMKIIWNSPEVGFGEITFNYNKEGNLEIDTEGMGAQFVENAFGDIIDKCLGR